MCKISEMNLETAKYYGYEAQSNQLVEECAELIQAVNKYRRVETGPVSYTHLTLPTIRLV